ncbi:hypothetical protein NIES2111_15970 [Nostoc sp. NIES-2111]|jgi:hypothetical protein|nr:hypothetical protein NIES2111_15970 [Nostoc sp. NIES-2111]
MSTNSHQIMKKTFIFLCSSLVIGSSAVVSYSGKVYAKGVTVLPVENTIVDTQSNSKNVVREIKTSEDKNSQKNQAQIRLNQSKLIAWGYFCKGCR